MKTRQFELNGYQEIMNCLLKLITNGGANTEELRQLGWKLARHTTEIDFPAMEVNYHDMVDRPEDFSQYVFGKGL